MTNTSGCPGIDRSRSTCTRPARSSGDAECARQRRGGDARGPEHRARLRCACSPSATPVASTSRDGAATCAPHAERCERSLGLVRESSPGRPEGHAARPRPGRCSTRAGRWRENRCAARCARSRRARPRARRRSGRRRRPRRSGRRARAASSVSRSARSNARSTRRRISSASSSVFRPGAIALPVLVAEVRVADAGREDEIVVSHGLAVLECERFASPRSTPSPCRAARAMFAWRRRMERIGYAMSPGESPAVATW